jgi:hypothetical protein
MIRHVFSVSFALLLTTTAAFSQDEWRVHHNKQYGFSLTYPASIFALSKTSDAGDAHIFNAPRHDARLLLGVLVNHDGYTPSSYFSYVASRSYPGYAVTYRKVGPSWFAISGEKDGKIFYEKVQFSCNSRLISSFVVVYPTSRQRTINPLIERMENTFRSARNCDLDGR